VAAVVWGWAAAQYPYLLPSRYHRRWSRRTRDLGWLVLVVVVAVLLVVHLKFSSRLDQQSRLDEGSLEVRMSQNGSLANAPPPRGDRGGGFGLCRGRKSLKHAPWITLIDKTNYHCFSHCFTRVAAGVLSPGTSRRPSARCLRPKNVDVRMAEVTGIDGTCDGSS
jgi:hypothetical protein